MSEPPNPSIIVRKPDHKVVRPLRPVKAPKSELRARHSLGGEPAQTQEIAPPSEKE
jgi:hypothetical protein